MRMRSFLPALIFLTLTSLAQASLPAYETVSIPAGEMTLEIPLDFYFENAHLSVTVKVGPGLRMGRYEVSNRLWRQCHQAGGCAKAAEIRDDEGENHPVARVDWHQAQEFATWISKATGRRLRLPTEGEWYYIFSLGKGFKIISREYDYSDLEAVRKIPKKTWPLGKFGENEWGISDMLGNVWEWTLSCYTLAENKLKAPVNIERLQKPETCSTRIVGGQNRAHVPDFINDTYNGGCLTVEPTANLGFRLVEEIQP